VPRYRLTIAYDGTDYCGWQKQEPPTPENGGHISMLEHVEPGLEAATAGRLALRTVQGVVERAVREIVREPVNVKGSSRTDSGVHARGQVAAFTCSPRENEEQRVDGGWPLERGIDRLVRAINGRLPDDVLVLSAAEADWAFNPVGDTESKAYSYTIHTSRTRPLWDRRYVCQLWDVLDPERMQAAAQVLVGEHDFAGFAAAGHGRLTTVRTIYSCSITTLPDERIRIDVSGNGFLYNMVRIIAGTLAEAGRGRITPEHVREILRTGDRAKAGPTLPPTGLCLEWIRYKGEPQPA
jgi:tRNA pseudouridine38-40 synthase